MTATPPLEMPATNADAAPKVWPELQIRDVRAQVFQAPIDIPVRTSFGVMRDRSMVLVRVEDRDGGVGWGEVWCNFPACGAEHRARLVTSVFAPLLTGLAFSDPRLAFKTLTARTRVLALQSGEPGPFAQCIAGLDTALWDLVARRIGCPLWRLLGGVESTIRVYASGLNPEAPERLAARKRADGYQAFKLKVGFGLERDLANLRAMRAELGRDCTLMVDANQAWDLATAAALSRAFEAFDVAWLEEPLAADSPWDDWRALRAQTTLSLAAGENIAGMAAFDAAIESGALAVVQPDLTKWGGFSEGLPLARRVRAAGLRFCPHYLGGGIGLLASAHLVAAAGGDGLLEVDANENPLRTALAPALSTIENGACTLGQAPGLGVNPDLRVIERFRVFARTD